jgi:8-oxo-dGTP pyrophosphatase MutT (NUDIX family)
MSGGRSRILRVAELDLKLRQRAWRFAEERADDIHAHWRKRQTEQPSLFDGRVLLMGEHDFVSREDGETILRGEYFETDFKAFLAWRDFGFPDPSVCNGFSMAALQASDGAYLLGQMSEHTANAGAIYFAAGTPDPSDVFDGRVDLRASVVRELEEETGLKANDLVVAEDWVVVDDAPRIACMKPVRAAEDAETLKARIEKYLASEERPELASVHIARSPADLDETRMARFTVEFLRYALGERRVETSNG